MPKLQEMNLHKAEVNHPKQQATAEVHKEETAASHLQCLKAMAEKDKADKHREEALVKPPFQAQQRLILKT